MVLGTYSVPSECPCCGTPTECERRVDNNGPFKIASCPECPWGMIADPENPDLEAEYRPRCC